MASVPNFDIDILAKAKRALDRDYAPSDDDEYMSARNTADMHAFYASAPREMRRIAPQDIGATRIGHFGFFRQRFAESLWPQVSRWLTPSAAR